MRLFYPQTSTIFHNDIALKGVLDNGETAFAVLPDEFDHKLLTINYTNSADNPICCLLLSKWRIIDDLDDGFDDSELAVRVEQCEVLSGNGNLGFINGYFLGGDDDNVLFFKNQLTTSIEPKDITSFTGEMIFHNEELFLEYLNIGLLIRIVSKGQSIEFAEIFKKDASDSFKDFVIGCLAKFNTHINDAASSSLANNTESGSDTETQGEHEIDTDMEALLENTFQDCLFLFTPLYYLPKNPYAKVDIPAECTYGFLRLFNIEGVNEPFVAKAFPTSHSGNFFALNEFDHFFFTGKSDISKVDIVEDKYLKPNILTTITPSSKTINMELFFLNKGDVSEKSKASQLKGFGAYFKRSISQND